MSGFKSIITLWENIEIITKKNRERLGKAYGNLEKKGIGPVGKMQIC